MTLKRLTRFEFEHLQKPLHLDRVWQNPFYLPDWTKFWLGIKLMQLFDRPQPSIVLYSSDYFEGREKVMEKATEFMGEIIDE